jgi:hypothetical protein
VTERFLAIQIKHHLIVVTLTAVLSFGVIVPLLLDIFQYAKI